MLRHNMGSRQLNHVTQRKPEASPSLNAVDRTYESAFSYLYGAVFSDTCGHSFLPIQSFKSFSGSLLQRVTQFAKIFRSSGTTQGNRAVSPFSSLGLSTYLTSSTRHFIEVLQSQGLDPMSCQGYSLVPTADQWPDSSLAAMIEAISKRLKLRYIESLSEIETTNQPVWVLGTSFHFVNCIDAGQRKALHPASLVFETGGTKGQSRHLTRSELHDLMTSALSLPPARILGEYGMCELASQAYDHPCAEAAPHERRYRFPDEVTLHVMIDGKMQASGEGSLVVHDPKRIDIPWPILTQDYVELFKDQSFRLLGRSLQAPSKGCSLMAEELFEATSRPDPAKARNRALAEQTDLPEVLRERSQQLSQILQDLWNHPELLSTLARFCSSTWTYEQLTNELASISEARPQDWQRAGERAVGGSLSKTPKEWLLIAPNNHPIALWHPIAIAYLLDLKLTIKPSREHLQSLRLFCQAFIDRGADIEILNPDFRLQAYSPAEAPAILIFGSDETIGRLHHQGFHLSRAFGSLQSAALIKSSHLEQHTLQLLANEAFSLNQQGCLSTKICLIHDDQDWGYAKIWQFIQSHLSHLRLPTLRAKESDSLYHYSLELQLNGQLFSRPQPRGPLFYPVNDSDLVKTIQGLEMLPAHVLPIAIRGSAETYQDCLQSLLAIDTLGRISVNYRTPNQPAARVIKKLGEGHIAAWNGLHLGEPLFQVVHRT